MKIAIGCDHAGFPYKAAIQKMLESQGHKVSDFGTDSTDSVDYPDFVHPVAKSVEGKEVKLGVLICGSGNGVCMTANKHAQIRAAVCWNTDLATLARQHNNANIICIPARFISKRKALSVVDAFMTASFEGGRHARRVRKISTC